MAKHKILKVYRELPEGTRPATDKDFFTAEENLRIGMPYFWQRLMEKTYNASRVRQDSYDVDLRQAIQGKRVWVMGE